MIRRIVYFLFLVCLSGTAFCEERSYLLADDHPIKAELDALFLHSRVVFNLKTLRAAGFVTSGPRKFTKIVVASHPDFPDYIFKLFLDAQRYDKPESLYEYFAQRIEGARLVQDTINKNGWQDLFKVPRKWIYKLPKGSKGSSEFVAKGYILVEDNMYVESDEVNEASWKGERVSQDFLEIFFKLISVTGYRDVKPANTPFSLDGKVAFVDTQTFLTEVRYEKMTPYLSAKNQRYWKGFIKRQKGHQVD